MGECAIAGMRSNSSSNTTLCIVASIVSRRASSLPCSMLSQRLDCPTCDKLVRQFGSFACSRKSLVTVGVTNVSGLPCDVSIGTCIALRRLVAFFVLVNRT